MFPDNAADPRQFRAALRYRVPEVRYEELVHQPRATMQLVAAFLDLPFDERMLHHHELNLHLGDVERTPHLQGVWEPIHEKAIGRWRSDFTTGQIAELEQVLGPTLAMFGYNK